MEPMTGIDKLKVFARKVGMPNFMHGGDINQKVWILWNDSIQTTHVYTSDQYITVKVIVSPDVQFNCTFVYASISKTRWEILWGELLSDSQSITGPWIIAGDFNTISSWAEKKGGARRDTCAMSEFNNFQMQAGLSDAGYSESKYTWSNNRTEEGQIWMRLDRVLVNGPALARLPSLKVQHLTCLASDHTPLLISLGEAVKRPASFKYLRAWHEHADFLSIVETEWCNHSHTNPILAFAIKLKALWRRLKDWNWSTFGNVKLKIQALLAKVNSLEQALQHNLTQATEDEITMAKDALSRTQRQQFQMLADKAQAHWVAEGDRNTTLFHAMIKAHRSNNNIQIEMPDGTMTSDRKKIVNLALDHFSSILSSFSVVPALDAFDTVSPTITQQDNLALSSALEEEEIHQAVIKLNPSSSPGPDGFTGHFYTHCWHIIKDDLIKAVQGFFQGLTLPGAITATNLVLIPKKLNASRVDQLRPISLCNFIHKVISGILNARISLLLPRIISQEQSCFMPGRGSMDSIALAHDLTCHINNGHPGGNILMKIDMSKAYDRVSWIFLLRMLQALGFDRTWCDLIYHNISNCWYSMLWDGSSYGHFKSNQGVRQGDPLSPTLFIVCMEAFSRLLQDQVALKKIYPYFVKVGALVVSHLLYADDMLIFTNGHKTSMDRLMLLIRNFCTNSEQLL
ncbi:hypothetical protein QQ045_001803 [Rhodiola kirilowii]